MKRQWFYCFISFAQNADIHMSGKTITCTLDNSVLLVVSRLSSYSSSILSSTSRSKDQSNYSRQLRTFLDPATTRSDKHECGKPMLADDKQATENREPANEMNKEDPTQGIPVWLQPFTVILEDLEALVVADSSERENSDSEGDASKVETQKQKHSVHAYLCKNQKSSVLCYKFSPPNGTHVKPKLHTNETEKNLRKLTETVAEAKSYSYVQFIRIWQALWRIIMESSNKNSSSIRDNQNCRTSRTSSNRRDISRIIAIWIGW